MHVIVDNTNGSEEDDNTIDHDPLQHSPNHKTKQLLNLGSSSQRFRHIHGKEPSKQGSGHPYTLAL